MRTIEEQIAHDIAKPMLLFPLFFIGIQLVIAFLRLIVMLIK